MELLKPIEAEGQEANETHEQVLYHLALIHDALEFMGTSKPDGRAYRDKWTRITTLNRAESFGAHAKYKEVHISFCSQSKGSVTF